MSLNDLYYKLDTRNRTAILADIERLAESYTPEWLFTTKNPDAGSVIAMIYASQLEDSVNRLNLIMQRYRTELVNMMGLSLKPAFPAMGIVSMSLIQNIIEGVNVPKGTKLLASAEDESNIVFETTSDLYVTNSQIADIINVSRKHERVVSVYGGAKKAYFSNENVISEELAEGAFDDEKRTLPKFGLFDFSGENLARSAVLLMHEHIFNTINGSKLKCRIDAGDKTDECRALLSNGELFEWLYYENGEYRRFASVTLSDDELSRGEILLAFGDNAELPNDEFSLGEDLSRGEGLSLGDGLSRGEGIPRGEQRDVFQSECSYIMIKALKPIEQTIELKSIAFSSDCGEIAPDCVCHNDTEETVAHFMPFGDRASLNDMCYICANRILAQKNASVSIDFDLSYAEKRVSFLPEQENDELKPIKKKPYKIEFATSRAVIDTVAFEYFNGTGWSRLPLETDEASLFAGANEGHVTLRFSCPETLSAIVAGGFEGKCIRIKVLRSDNCYMQPCIHTMPVIDNLKLSYTYGGRSYMPQKAERISGCRCESITRELVSSGPTALFKPLELEKNSVLIGFDKPICGAPASLYLGIANNISYEMPQLDYEYSVDGGFSPLKTIDNTEGFSHSGTMRFLPPSDWRKTEHFGVSRYWLRIVDVKNAYNDLKFHRAQLDDIIINSIDVLNIETKAEESYYIDTATPNMMFELHRTNILSAEVFVNELSGLTIDEMNAMATASPDSVRCETDRMGNVIRFFVRWTEVPSFDKSKSGDRHYVIDRMNGLIYFGDGVNVRIPQAQPDAAFTVTIVCCNGDRGNLPAHSIESAQSKLEFIGSITNPVASFSGSDMEDINEAHERGAAIVSAKNRLVSELDYEREIKAFSGSIDKVKCVTGITHYGREDFRAVTAAILLTDYKHGNGTFAKLADRMKPYLLSRCEMTVSKDDLTLMEPQFAELSVSVWISVRRMDNVYEIQSAIEKAITDFVDPVRGGYDGCGWDIGTLPNESQIAAVIKSSCRGFVLDKMVMTGKYSDRSGLVEESYATLSKNPFICCVNGKHTIAVKLLS